jgi:sulfur-oxidizing protein SoxZ
MAKHRARATSKGGVTTVKAIISHPMETGLRKDKKTGKKVPAHYIETLTVTNNGKAVLNADWGPAISKNPLLHFNFKGGKAGDKVVISFNDNKGQKGSVATTVR